MKVQEFAKKMLKSIKQTNMCLKKQREEMNALGCTIGETMFNADVCFQDNCVATLRYTHCYP